MSKKQVTQIFTGGQAVVEQLKKENVKYVFGLIGSANLSAYDNLHIRGHEEIYFDRAQERTEQMLNLNAQIGPIYVIHPDNKTITWVASNSRGYNIAKLLDANLMSACYVEAGIDATAGCAELTRK